MSNAIHEGARIYVAGHRGLVGSALLRTLNAHGYHNVVVRTHRELDLTDGEAVRAFFHQEKPEYVLLAAAKVGGILANNTYPADFICEGVDQTRGWFYSLLAIATAAFDAPAYRHVIVNELVLDAEGQKMSKSRGNVVNPWEMIAEFGADTVRLYLLASSQVWLPKRFDRAAIPEAAGKFLNALRSTYEFFQLYGADMDKAILSARKRAFSSGEIAGIARRFFVHVDK
jgi:hypothetical protein